MPTPPDFTAYTPLAAATLNQVGQWEAIPTSISGTGATQSRNKITLSSCIAVQINGVFTSSFENYLIVMRVQMNGDNVFAQLSSGGTPVTTNTYNWAMTQSYAGVGVSAVRTAATSSMIIAVNNNNVFGSTVVDVFAPQLATPTMFQAHCLRNDGGYGVPANYLLYGNNSNATSYDGLKISSGVAMTGTIYFYGRN